MFKPRLILAAATIAGALSVAGPVAGASAAPIPLPPVGANAGASMSMPMLPVGADVGAAVGLPMFPGDVNVGANVGMPGYRDGHSYPVAPYFRGHGYFPYRGDGTFPYRRGDGYGYGREMRHYRGR